jgi:sugar phosphate isomerase/epimerase
MQTISRRTFLGAAAATAVAPPIFAADEPRFQIGIQEYTFHRLLAAGKLDHLDYPALAKDKLGITQLEYFNRPFGGKHTNKGYVGELVKRSTGEGMTNLLILVDAKEQIDSADAAERTRSLDEHKAWVDCAAQLGCSAIRVNCRSGGELKANLMNAVDGMGRLCDYAKGSGVNIAIEPHGGNSQNPDWLLSAIKALARPNAKLLPDFNNFGKFDRYEGVTKTLPHAVAVCAKALNFDDKGLETNTDFFRMLKIVHDSDFKGVISIEFEGHDIDPVEGALKTKALIERALEAAAA